MSTRDEEKGEPTEIYLAPVLGDATRKSAVPANDTGQWPAVMGPLWQEALEASAKRKAARRAEREGGAAEKPGKPARMFQRLSRQVSVQAGQSYSVRAKLRNNAEFPLGASVHGVIEIVWLDAKGCELGRVTGRRFGKDLSSVRWTGVAVCDAKAPAGVVSAMIFISLYDEEREGGSIWVRGLTVDPRPGRQEARLVVGHAHPT